MGVLTTKEKEIVEATETTTEPNPVPTPTPTPAAPYGVKADGTPRKRPGRRPKAPAVTAVPEPPAQPPEPAPVAVLRAPKVGSPFVAQMLEQQDAEIARLQNVRQAIVEKAAA